MGAEPSPDSGNSFTASAHPSQLQLHLWLLTRVLLLLIKGSSRSSPALFQRSFHLLGMQRVPKIPLILPPFPRDCLSLGSSILCGAVDVPAASKEKLFSDGNDSLSPLTDFKAAFKTPNKMLDFPHSSPDGRGKIRDISVINLKMGQNWGDRTQSPLKFSLSPRDRENEEQF